MSKSGDFVCVMCGKPIDINKEGFQFHGSISGGAQFRHYKSGCDLKKNEPKPNDSGVAQN